MIPEARGSVGRDGLARVCAPESADLQEPPGGDQLGIMNMAAYTSVAIGYLLSVLIDHQLALGPFALFTTINLAWVAVFHHMQLPRVPPETTKAHVVALTALAVAALFCLPLGLGFDWMLPTVTTAVAALTLRWRLVAPAVAAFVAASALAIALAGAKWADIGMALVQTVPAYLFAIVFSLVLRRQQQLRKQAEDLAAELSRSNAALERAHVELRGRASQAEELAVARERNRMAREIHDTLGHYLTILAVQLETALKLEERGDVRLRAELVEARRVAVESLSEVRRSVAALRPADLSAMSLPEALRRLVAETEALLPATTFALDLAGPVQTLAPEARIALYRCAQEALTNIRKHASASKVLVRLRVGAGEVPDGDSRNADESGTGEVELTVLDNGRGEVESNGDVGATSKASEHVDGFGLLGMRERIVLLGGTLRAGAEPGTGWRVEVRLPRCVPIDTHTQELPGTLLGIYPATTVDAVPSVPSVSAGQTAEG